MPKSRQRCSTSFIHFLKTAFIEKDFHPFTGGEFAFLVLALPDPARLHLRPPGGGGALFESIHERSVISKPLPCNAEAALPHFARRDPLQAGPQAAVMQVDAIGGAAIGSTHRNSSPSGPHTIATGHRASN